MADQLYLSLWYPNFRLDALPAALIGVLRQFAFIATDGKPNSPFGAVEAASAYAISWTESPTYQRIYKSLSSYDKADAGPATEGAHIIESAVAEATQQLHMDSAYEFEMRWPLFVPVDEPDRTWRMKATKVRILGFGPDFDDGSFAQNGHLRVDFGIDAPWVPDDEHLDRDSAVRIELNVKKLLAFTLLVEKHCGISSRLLWTESGEPLAEKLIARLQRLN